MTPNLIRLLFAAAVLVSVQPTFGWQSIAPDYQAVLTTLGKTGDVKDGVLKINIPRNDLTVTIKGRPAPTP